MFFIFIIHIHIVENFRHHLLFKKAVFVKKYKRRKYNLKKIAIDKKIYEY